MPNYDLNQLATYYNSLPEHHQIFKRRVALVNNTLHYYTGDNYVHLRTIQMVNHHDLHDLFGNFVLDYANQSIDFFQGRDVPDPGDLEISMMMERDFRAPGNHLAVFIFYLFPHRQFYDGHVIQIEFDEGSIQHQTIERLFNTNTYAVVLQATQYQILSFLADEHEMLDLLHLFLVGFNPIKFSFDGTYYFVDPEAADNHREHNCCDNQMVAIMQGLPWHFPEPAVNEAAGADDEINQGFVDEDEDDIIIINHIINDYNIRNITNYPANEPEPNFRVQG